MVCATGLPIVRIELRLGQSGRHPGIQPVGDGLEVEILLIVDLEAEIEVQRLRVIVAVAG